MVNMQSDQAEYDMILVNQVIFCYFGYLRYE